MRLASLLAFLLFTTRLPATEPEKKPVAVVSIFIATDCPIANSYAPEINRIWDDYSEKGIEIQLVYPDPEVTEVEVSQHVAEYSLTPATVIDRDHTLVKKAGVTITPEVAVSDSAGKVIYRGRIDNLYADYGERRREVTERYLRDALDAILKGDTPTVTKTGAIGCLIEILP
ncbi:MAG: redoxin family protein [Verrucomicrobiales bacterium]